MARIYQLAFRDTTGSLVTVMDLTGAVQMRYSKTLNGCGAFLLTLPADLSKPIMSTLDAVVQVIWSDEAGQNVIDGTYLLRRFAPVGEGLNDVFMVGGVGLEHLLWRRIFLSEDDPLEVNGFSTKSGPADTVMSQVIDEQCITPATNTSRALPGLQLGPVAGTGSSVAFREESSDTKVLELVRKLAAASGADFWVEYGQTGPTFTVQLGTVGTDRRKSTNSPLGLPYVYFAPQLGNLDQPELDMDRQEEQNHVYVFGQGPAGSRLVYGQVGSGAADSPWNDCEFGVQAKNTKTLDDWLTEADAALNDERTRLTSFTFRPQKDTRFALYGRDWFLGDKVTVAYQDHEFEMRIPTVEITVTSEGDDIKPTMELLA